MMLMMVSLILISFSFLQTKSTEEIESLLNIGPKIRLLVVKNDVYLHFPVSQLCSSILEKEIVKTIIQIESDEDEIIEKLKTVKENVEALKNRVNYWTCDVYKKTFLYTINLIT